MRIVRDTWFLFVPRLQATLRNPIWLLVDLSMPICYLLLFAPLLASLPGGLGIRGGALMTFTPALLVMLSLYSVIFAGYTLVAELRQGVIERLQVTPVSRFALLLGRMVYHIAILLSQALLLLLVAWLLGLRANLAGILVSFLLLILLGVLMASFSYALALSLKNEQTMGPALSLLTTPLLLLSGILLPLDRAPEPLRLLSEIDPLKYAVDAARDLFLGNVWDGKVLQGFIMLVSLALVALWWAASTFRRAIA